jgi:hypothetical protein
MFLPNIKKRLILLFVLGIFFSGCSTWSYSTVDGEQNSVQKLSPTSPQSVIISATDITDRRYEVLGDITATVNKTTVFHPSPTRQLVDVELKEKAAEMGADAVILVRYGSTGISLMSWGSLEGKGRAIKFLSN